MCCVIAAHTQRRQSPAKVYVHAQKYLHLNMKVHILCTHTHEGFGGGDPKYVFFFPQPNSHGFLASALHWRHEAQDAPDEATQG